MSLCLCDFMLVFGNTRVFFYFINIFGECVCVCVCVFGCVYTCVLWRCFVSGRGILKH